MNKGVSELIAMVLSILFGVVMITLVLTVLNPTLDRAKDSGTLTEAFQNLPLLDSAIQEVSSESQNSRRTIDLTVNDGVYAVDGANDYITFTYEPKEDMLLSGRRGDIYIERGYAFSDFFNNYVENANGRPNWINITGKWNVASYKYRGIGGLAYHNVGKYDRFKLSGTITNISGTGGEIFAVPGSPINLIGFWSFDEGTGSKAYDWSGNLNNGTLTDMNTTGNATSGWNNTDCKFGSCLIFDGVNDYVDIGNDASLNYVSGNPLTVEGWFYSNGDWQGGLVGKHPWAYLLANYDANNLQLFVDGITRLLTTVPKNQWVHIAISYDGASGIMYVNGVQSGASETFSIPSSTAQNYIGYDNRGYYFKGTIDEVKIWNRSLTADEVKAEYELSTKKLKVTGSTDYIAQSTNVTVVLANPDGTTDFDDIKVNHDDKGLKLIIPYTKIDLNGTGRFAKGEHQVVIEHMGVNSTLNEPMIQIS